MKRHLLFALVAFVTLGTLLPATVAAQEFEEDVDRMIGMVVEAWNEEDPKALAGLFTDDADLLGRDGRWYTGPDEIQGYFEEWMATTDGAKDIRVQRQRILTEEVAVVDVISAVVPEGGSFWGEGVERVLVSVSVLRQRDGSWRFSSWRECHEAK